MARCASGRRQQPRRAASRRSHPTTATRAVPASRRGAAVRSRSFANGWWPTSNWTRSSSGGWSPIFAEMRGKFVALREMPEDARTKAGNAIRAELRAKIEDILKPEQKARYAEIAAEFGGRAGGGQQTRGRLWALADGKPRAIEVSVGLSDGSMTEVSGEGVSEGMEVIVGQQGGAGSAAPAQKGAPPRMFFLDDGRTAGPR